MLYKNKPQLPVDYRCSKIRFQPYARTLEASLRHKSAFRKLLQLRLRHAFKEISSSKAFIAACSSFEYLLSFYSLVDFGVFVNLLSSRDPAFIHALMEPRPWGRSGRRHRSHLITGSQFHGNFMISQSPKPFPGFHNRKEITMFLSPLWAESVAKGESKFYPPTNWR